MHFFWHSYLDRLGSGATIESPPVIELIRIIKHARIKAPFVGVDIFFRLLHSYSVSKCYLQGVVPSSSEESIKMLAKT